jgi:hypothetical protein
VEEEALDLNRHNATDAFGEQRQDWAEPQRHDNGENSKSTSRRLLDASTGSLKFTGDETDHPYHNYNSKFAPSSALTFEVGRCRLNPI